MKIEDKRIKRKEIEINGIESNKFFEWRGSIYLKTSLRDNNLHFSVMCVNISKEAQTEYFSDEALVTPLNAKVVIED